MPYRFAIIGCGNISRRHAAAIKSAGTLLAVCDINESKADSLGREFDVPAYYNISDLLDKVAPDIVTVCSPNGLHPHHVIAALRSGSHVLCEKPLSISVDEGSWMVEEAGKSGKRLFVVKQNRYNPPVIAVKSLLDQGKLGKILSFQINCFWNRPASYYAEPWRGTLFLDGGTLFTQFSHFIDILYWFLGEIEHASGWRANLNHQNLVEFEDTGVANLIMKNGAVGNIHYTINAHQSNLEGSITLFGEKGTVKIGGSYLNQMEFFSVENVVNPLTLEGQPPNSYDGYQGSMGNHPIVYTELLKALEDPEHAFVEAAEALKSVEMIRQIYNASPLIPRP
jgi:UDP-N-acetyl-2-amino-2-deoxyglucuronate dehydrogenase